MQKKKFKKLHEKYLKYPSASDLQKSARNFAAFCLNLDPVERPAVKDLLGHDLMNKSGFLPKKDKIWHKKGKFFREDSVKIMRELMHFCGDFDFVVDIFFFI